MLVSCSHSALTHLHFESCIVDMVSVLDVKSICLLSCVAPGRCSMQVNAVLRAAMAAQQSAAHLDVGLLVPTMASTAEFQHQAKLIKGCAVTLARQFSLPVVYKLGTVIESPVTCLLAPDLAAEADFLCLKTNRLLQQMYGMSHDEFRQFMLLHLRDSKPVSDPFEV
jgi:phosphoenolpyruvate-protein kinase (PTS system EI component)